MGYSGNTSFTFEVERYLNKSTGKYLPEKQAELEAKDHPFGEGWFELNYEYQMIPLEVEGSAYYQEGRHYGAPENCYPDEGDVEIIAVHGPNDEDWESNLTVSERDSIEEMIQENVMDGMDEPDDDDYYDDGDGDY